MSADPPQLRTVSTQVPSRLDRLPWSRFHWLVVVGLGTVWLLDGLEVTMVGSVAARLTDSDSGIDIGPGQIGFAAAIYIAGACLGALFFGQLTDRFGRKRLFILTLVIYIAATVATAFAFSPWYFYLARFVTGAGIGGEYAAINSAIDELIPARARGRVDLIINGTYWLGAAGGAAMALLFLNESLFPTSIGWRLAFGFGAVIGLAILLVRRSVPESPRWLFIHGREEEAERIVDRIEQDVVEQTEQPLPEPDASITVRQRRSIPFRTIAHTAFSRYPHRAVLSLALFVGQAFAYNGITFNLGTLLSTFYDVPSGNTPLFIVVWALGNFAGPVILGRLFDTVGRKPMISGCYLGAAGLIIPLTLVFVSGTGGEWGFLALLVMVFFLASAGASAAYLTVSEIFPMETRALAIAFFYAVGTAAGGIVGPVLFGQMIGTGVRDNMAVAFLISAGVLAIGGLAEIVLGVRAEQMNLERLATPLTAQSGESGESGGQPQQRAAQQDREAQRRREEAAELRARVAEHRATAQELRLAADRGDSAAQERVRVEEALAAATELRATALDERAAEHEHRAAADRAAGPHAREAAIASAEAADQRAQELANQERAVTAEHEIEASTYSELAAAAGERARAREQRALAERARAETDQADQADQGADQDQEPTAAAALQQARADMHEAWSAMHEARSRRHAAQSAQDEASAQQAEQEAVEAENRALAAEQRVTAGEHRTTAEDLRAEREATPAGTTEPEPPAAEPEQRIRERIARRQRRERAGLRRLRPGPGSRLQSGRSGGWESGAEDRNEAALDQEIEMIARALDQHGAVDRHDLAQLVGARYWGPGRFGMAVRAAVDEGRARRVSRRSYGPADGRQPDQAAGRSGGPHQSGPDSG